MSFYSTIIRRWPHGTGTCHEDFRPVRDVPALTRGHRCRCPSHGDRNCSQANHPANQRNSP